jgi:hypothetical protein
VTPFDPRLPIIAAQARVKTPHVLHTFLAMREMGASFHIEAFAAFAGLEPRHVTAIMDALSHHAITAAKREATVRGTRLPNGWTLPPEWAAWATGQRYWTAAETDAEAELFANYWQAKSGQAAVKVDWQKTWRNWVRQSHRPNGTPPGRQVTAESRADDLRRSIALYERMGRGDETGDMRAELARLSDNVLPFNRVAQ